MTTRKNEDRPVVILRKKRPSASAPQPAPQTPLAVAKPARSAAPQPPPSVPAPRVSVRQRQSKPFTSPQTEAGPRKSKSPTSVQAETGPRKVKPPTPVQAETGPRKVKPPTPVQTTEAAPSGGSTKRKRQNQKRAERAHKIIELLQTRWPQTFVADAAALRPLAVGITQDVISALPDHPRWAIKQAVRVWYRRHQMPYWKVLMQGGPRYDLDGHPRGEVSPEQQAAARQQRDEWLAHQQMRKRESKPPREEPPLKALEEGHEKANEV